MKKYITTILLSLTVITPSLADVISINAQFWDSSFTQRNKEGDLSFELSEKPGVEIWDWTNKLAGAAIVMAKALNHSVAPATFELQGYESIYNMTVAGGLGYTVTDSVTSILFLYNNDFGKGLPFAVLNITGGGDRIIVTEKQAAIATLASVKGLPVTTTEKTITVRNLTDGTYEPLVVMDSIVIN